MPNNLNLRRVCGAVIAYFPDEDFERRLKGVLSQVDALVLVDNTPTTASTDPIRHLMQKEPKVRVIENHENLGLATALNQALNHALELGCKWILTIDQDTRCYADMVHTLTGTYEACVPKPAVVGGNYLDGKKRGLAVSADIEVNCQERTTVITSGSLIDAEVARVIGGFRDDYFIDQVDHEFCLRARAQGFRVVISRRPVMEHTVGGPGGARVPFLGTLPNHPPLRKYYITRNTVVTVAEYWRQEPMWCLRRIARLLLGLVSMGLLEDRRIAKVRAFGAGVIDGLRRRMGPCRHEWLNSLEQAGVQAVDARKG